MNAARNKANRPSKRVIVIDDDESTNDQPVVKREVEETPSSQVVELQQELRKSKEMFQRACLQARKEQLRAEAAESRLDSKYGIVDGLNADLKKSHEFVKKVNDLADQIGVQQQKAFESQARDRARIDELTQKLAQYEGMQQLQLQLQQPVAMPQLGGDTAAAADDPPSDGEDHQHCYPLADSALSDKLLDLVKNAKRYKQLKNGAKEAEKTLNNGISEMIIVAADAVDCETIRNLVDHCKRKKVPYVFAKTVIEFANVVRSRYRCAVYSITRDDRSKIESLIDEIKKDVAKLV